MDGLKDEGMTCGGGTGPHCWRYTHSVLGREQSYIYIYIYIARLADGWDFVKAECRRPSRTRPKGIHAEDRH